MAQVIGILLLIAAISVGIYLANNQPDILGVKSGSFNLKPSLSLPTFGGRGGSPPAGGGSTQQNGGSVAVQPSANPKPVRISSVSPVTSYRNRAEVALAANNLSQGERVNITGWKIRSNKSFVVIPQAQTLYSFDRINNDIYLNPSAYVYIYANDPVKGNFRLNKCTGYLEEASPFTPSIPKSCPYISRSDVTHLNSDCQDYILSLGTCQIPSFNPPVRLDDSACHDFLRQFNYDGCVSKHKDDSDFYQNDWRIWLGNSLNIFDSRHDKVQLLDANGKVVDEYTY